MREAAKTEICENERILNLPEIDQRHRHTVIFQLFEHLPPDRSLQLVSDHDPRLLRGQLEMKHGARCQWTYLEQGPDIWRVRLRRSAAMD
jgi:uncharacterized protein (DUF2249 family)